MRQITGAARNRRSRIISVYGRFAVPLALSLALISAGGCSDLAPNGNEKPSAVDSAQSPAISTPVESQSLTIERGDVQLAAVLEIPTPQAGKQMPLAIIMHGLGGDKEAPIHLALSKALAERGFATLRFDFNGHGASGGDFRDMTIPSEIEDARAVLSYAQGLDFVSEISMIGHSQGGVVASLLAGELVGTPEAEIASLVLLAPAYGIDQAAREGRYINQTYDPTDPPESLPLPWGGLSVGRDYLVTIQDLQIAQTAKRYTGPVLVIQGDADEVLLTSGAEEFAEVFPEGQVRIEAGHDHNFSKDPDQIAEIAAEFLDGNRR